MTHINVQEAKTHLSRYLDQVEAGEVIVLCRHNQPIAELRAVQPAAAAKPMRVAGLLKGQVHWDADAFSPMTLEEVADFDSAPIFPPTGAA